MNKDVYNLIKGWLDERGISDRLFCDYDEREPYYVEPEDPRYDLAVAHGASKIVFTDLSKTKVYKIAYTHTLEVDYDLSITKNLENWFMFSYEYNHNYCAKEAYYYENAYDRGVKDIFAKSVYCCTINGLDVYEQEKIDRTGIEDADNSYCSKERYDRLSALYNRKMRYKPYSFSLGTDIMVRFLDYYGYDFILKVFDFCKDNHINDISSWNVGFSRVDKRPIIFDYSGYFED